MNLSSVLIALGAGWWLAATLTHIGSIVAALLQPAIRRRRETNERQPPVSVIIPVKEMEPELSEAFASLYGQDYPRFEVLVSASDGRAPALAVARETGARYPAISSRMFTETVSQAMSPKLNNLIAPLAAAGHDLIFVKDSNIRLGRKQLALFVRGLTAGAGLVVAVPVAEQPENFPAEIERAIMNGYQGRLLSAASALGFGFGHGKAMLFDRRELERAGGIAAIAGAVNEDHYLSKALAAIGLKTVFASETVRQALGERRFADVWKRQLRWMVCRRQSEPWAFYVEPLFNAVIAAAAGALAASLSGHSGWLAFAASLLFWLLAEAAFVLLKRWGWSWRTPAAALCREFILLGLWLSTWRTRRIMWGELAFDVRR